MDHTGRARLREAQNQFSAENTYLNTATHGLTPHASRTALEAHVRETAAGRFSAGAVDSVVDAARTSYARLVGTAPDRVAVGTHTSQFVGTIAAILPAGSEVLLAEGEFTSVVFPLMARQEHGVRVREVPLDRLPDEVGPGTALVAVAAVQSATGKIAPVEDLITACADHGARLMLDTSQAAGWLSTPLDRVDYVVCSTYKWLLGPRGAAFLTGTGEALAELSPLAPGWFAGAEPWNSLYGGPLRLAEGTRRLDLAPVWPAWIGLAPSLDLLNEVGVATIHAHDAALADRFRSAMGLAETGSAIVSLPVPEGTTERLAEAGIAAAIRDGRLRVGFHLYNTEEDVDRLVKVLSGGR
ncbi:aminotransferase class V-fold PLP-dependent enzyme [Nocardiopsis ganjiahuensis]|uniref:aminotransferase class V-fold PLP-dependent enzyme n=1 Tax=Nocardiopsis ganjiahuensis TaxID=239984 RepID=UPI00034B30CD|nr:aminotransferase class V-fold PLP-dependent enzyme [Nocardiopsis ganjiahuensis]